MASVDFSILLEVKIFLNRIWCSYVDFIISTNECLPKSGWNYDFKFLVIDWYIYIASVFSN